MSRFQSPPARSRKPNHEHRRAKSERASDLCKASFNLDCDSRGCRRFPRVPRERSCLHVRSAGVRRWGELRFWRTKVSPTPCLIPLLADQMCYRSGFHSVCALCSSWYLVQPTSLPSIGQIKDLIQVGLWHLWYSSVLQLRTDRIHQKNSFDLCLCFE